MLRDQAVGSGPGGECRDLVAANPTPKWASYSALVTCLVEEYGPRLPHLWIFQRSWRSGFLSI